MRAMDNLYNFWGGMELLAQLDRIRRALEINPDGRTAWLTMGCDVDVEAGPPIHIHRGFRTDFASVPRVFWRMLPPWGRYTPAAVVHDFLYERAGACQLADRAGLYIYTRKMADRLFRQYMAVLAVPQWKRAVMYRALRIGGWLAWRRYSSKKRQG